MVLMSCKVMVVCGFVFVFRWGWILVSIKLLWWYWRSWWICVMSWFIIFCSVLIFGSCRVVEVLMFIWMLVMRLLMVIIWFCVVGCRVWMRFVWWWFFLWVWWCLKICWLMVLYWMVWWIGFLVGLCVVCVKLRFGLLLRVGFCLIWWLCGFVYNILISIFSVMVVVVGGKLFMSLGILRFVGWWI